MRACRWRSARFRNERRVSAAIAQEAGADIFVVQSTVSTVRHISSEYKSLDLAKFCRDMRIPVIVGNTVGYDATLEIMECGPAAVLIGVGPGAACTSRGVLGLGVPQVTATVDCAAARDAYFKKTARYVSIITDGGMSKGGDVCKALACGADAVMVGSAFAKAHEAPGGGYHWGMATPHANLPRGTRIKVGATGSLKQILFGRRKWMTAVRTWSVPSPPAWVTWAPVPSRSFSRPKSSSRPRSRPKASFSRPSKASEWEAGDREVTSDE